jgi:hypothetical protein
MFLPNIGFTAGKSLLKLSDGHAEIVEGFSPYTLRQT